MSSKLLKPALLILAGIVLLAAVLMLMLVPERYRAWTDDAYVQGHVVTISPHVAAYIQALHIDDNSHVVSNASMVKLDSRDFENAVTLATADLRAAESQEEAAQDSVAVADQTVAQSKAELSVADANASLARISLRRLKSVSDMRAVSQQSVDDASAGNSRTEALVQVARVGVQAAQARRALAQAQVTTARASVEQAQARLAQARLNLSYTDIRAEMDGYVTDKTAEPGNYVQPSQTLFSLVPDSLYIIANYRETQVTQIRPGQPVLIHVDAFPGQVFHGHVDSLQRGTGSRFALLPPQNATGNFIKVVQRVPVKIILDESVDAQRWLAPGLSVEPTVIFGPIPWWLRLLDQV